MRVALLGFTVPDSIVEFINERDRAQANQTHRFAWSLVEALQAGGAKVELLSAAPVSDFPHGPGLIWGSVAFARSGVRGRTIPFVNAVFLKHLSRSLSVVLFGLSLQRRFKPNLVLIHGVHTPFLAYGALLRTTSAEVVVVLTDPPGQVLSTDGLLRRVLKRFDRNITRTFVKRMSGVVALSDPLAQAYAPSMPRHIMEGIWRPLGQFEGRRTQKASSDEVVITYAGGLTKQYGVRDLVDAVVRSADPRLRLQLFGKGDLEPWIVQISRNDERIVAPRLVNSEEVAEAYSRSDILVQPRPQSVSFAKYSFPSKLIEYMGSGVPVISTRLSSIPEDYEPYVVWTDEGAESLKHAIEDVASWSTEEREEFGRQSGAFIRSSRGVVSQGVRLVQFLQRCCKSGT